MGVCSSSTSSGKKMAASSADGEGDFYDVVAASDESEIGEGQVKVVKLGDKVECLLIRQNGALSAIGSKCSHFGAPLAKGSLGDGVIRCPFHGACFDVVTGDIEDFPGMDSLPKYDVSVDGDGKVRIRAEKSLAGKFRVKKKPPPTTTASDGVVVIVGGGPSAQMCAETLRTRPVNPWAGRIVMLTEESDRPYDRTKLSKSMTSTAESLSLRGLDFYDETGIEVKAGARVIRIDPGAKSVETESGDAYAYDHLVLATGGKPVEAASLEGLDAAARLSCVFTLRSPRDANAIAERSAGRKVVVVGSSFIGMEVAAYLAGKASSVTVVGRSATPFAASLGERVGRFVMAMHEAKGVRFEMGTVPERFVADADGKLAGVVIRGGKKIVDADVCVLGLGVMPATGYAASAGLEMDARGHVIVDRHMRTNLPGVFAVGDIAKFPLELPGRCRSLGAAIGHFQMALNHGKTAGLNVGAVQDGDLRPVSTVPFFWTVQFGKSIRYAGFAPDGFDEVLFDGVVEDGKFVAYYVKGEVVVAVASLMRDPVVADFANLLAGGGTLRKDDVATDAWRKSFELKILD